MRQRVKATVLGVLVLFAYFWTGAVAKLWLMRAEPGGAGMVGDLHRRAFRGSSPIGLNSEFRTLMSVYGPMPLGPLLGPGSASFLRGLGVGLDPNSTRYEAQRREALERNLRLRILNPWRGQACLELAAMDAIPGAPSPGFARRPVKLAGAPAWITVGLVDPERWWVVRQPAGPDPAQAEALCAQALAGHPQDAVAAQALYLRASLAADRWDFRAEAEDWRELVLEHPASPLAEAALGYLAQGPAGGAEELIPLYQHALRHRPPGERTGLALSLAMLQARNGEVEAARATLRQALRALEPAESAHPEEAANRRHPLEQTLRSLEGKPDFPPPPSPAAAPGFPVRTRLLAAGKPLAGITVALVPLAEAFQGLPYPAALEAGAPRPAGVYPPPQPSSFSPMQTGASWNMEAVAAALRRDPSLVARSDTAGVVRWPSVPAGAYALFVRLASWQIPDGGRRLSPVPTRAPVWVSAGAATLPAIRFIPPPRLTTGRTAAGIPSLRWQAVPGAARYRVALRDVTGATLMAAFEGEAGGSGAPEIDPAVIWWRDGVTGTGLQLTPAQFVGPAADRDRRGLLPGRWYSWYVEARANNGAVLATSESVGPPAILGGPFWLALRPPQPRPQERRRRLPLLSTAAGPPPGAAGPPPGANEFTSPFLQVLIRAPESETVRLVERPRLPQVATNGQGLPPRGPIRLASAPPGPAAGMPPAGQPGALPPALLARLQGLRRAPGLRPSLAAGSPERMPAFGGELPPQLLAQLQRARPGGPPPAGLPPLLLAQLAAGRPQPGGALPPPGHGPRFGPAGLPAATLASVPHEGAVDHRSNTAATRAKPPARTVPPAAAELPPGQPLSADALRPPSIELERFGPGCMERWRAAGENAPGESAGDGLPIRQPLTLIPSGPPLELPPGSRRILARLAGAPADLTVTLSSSRGEQRQLSLRAEAGQQSVLSASVPAGTWSVAALTLTPPAAGDANLLSLTAEVAPTPGLFGTARQQGSLLELRLYNLGPAAEHAVVQGRAAAPLVETDLAPGGQVLLRFPLSALGESPLPAALTLRWRDRTRALPVR